MLISIVLNLIDLINLASRKFPFACSASFYHSRSLRFKWQKKKNNRRRTNDNDSRRQFSCCRHWCNKVNEYHSFVRGSRVRTSISGVGAIPIPNRKELRNQQKRERGEGAAGDDREVSLWHWLILPALSVARTLIHFHCCYLSVPIRREYFDRAYNLTRVYVQQSITVPMSSKRRNSMHWNVLWVPRRSVAAMNNKCNQWSVISVRVSRWSERRCGFFSLAFGISSLSSKGVTPWAYRGRSIFRAHQLRPQTEITALATTTTTTTTIDKFSISKFIITSRKYPQAKIVV